MVQDFEHVKASTFDEDKFLVTNISKKKTHQAFGFKYNGSHRFSLLLDNEAVIDYDMSSFNDDGKYKMTVRMDDDCQSIQVLDKIFDKTYREKHSDLIEMSRPLSNGGSFNIKHSGSFQRVDFLRYNDEGEFEQMDVTDEEALKILSFKKGRRLHFGVSLLGYVGKESSMVSMYLNEVLIVKE